MMEIHYSHSSFEFNRIIKRKLPDSVPTGDQAFNTLKGSSYFIKSLALLPSGLCRVEVMVVTKTTNWLQIYYFLGKNKGEYVLF